MSLRAAAVLVAVSLAAVSVPVVPASAQSWSYDRYERKSGPHSWGPRCVDNITTRGKAGIKLFSRKDKRQATERAINNWQDQVAEAFGRQYASWEKARGQDVSCNTKGFEVRCVVSAWPCR